MPEMIKTVAEFDNVVKSNPKVVVDFTATWCGPCRMIGPKFEAMESEFTGIKFIKVDVDENSDTSEKCGVSAMPTFHYYLNGEKFDELVGASEEKLKQGLTKLAGQ